MELDFVDLINGERELVALAQYLNFFEKPKAIHVYLSCGLLKQLKVRYSIECSPVDQLETSPTMQV